MRIGSFRHRGLRKFYENDDPSGLPADCIKRLRNILTALEFAAELSQVATMPGWRLHPLRGRRRSEYAVSVTANWRLTFRIVDGVVTDLSFEDYH